MTYPVDNTRSDGPAKPTPWIRMSANAIHLASTLLSNYKALGNDIDSINAKHFQVMFSGQYHQEREIQDAARVGLLKLYGEKRAEVRAQLTALGVEAPDA